MGGGAIWGEKICVVVTDGLIKRALEKKVVGGFLFCGAVGALGSFGKPVFCSLECCGAAQV